MLEELRQQYVLAFEPAAGNGLAAARDSDSGQGLHRTRAERLYGRRPARPGGWRDYPSRQFFRRSHAEVRIRRQYVRSYTRGRAGVRDQEVRPHGSRPGERQGHHAGHARSSRRRSASGRPKAQITEVDTCEGRRVAGAERGEHRHSRPPSAPMTASPRSTPAPKPSKLASRKILFEVVLSEDQGKFKFGKTELPDEAKSAIDQMVNGIKSQKSAVWIEIEGHTDNVGEQDVQRAARSRACRSSEALSLRAAPGAAPQDQRDQLRRRQAGAPTTRPATAAPRIAASSSRSSRKTMAARGLAGIGGLRGTSLGPVLWAMALLLFSQFFPERQLVSTAPSSLGDHTGTQRLSQAPITGPELSGQPLDARPHASPHE